MQKKLRSLLYTIRFAVGRSAVQMAPGPSQPPTPPCILSIGLLEVIAVLCNSTKHCSDRVGATLY